jgi:hypothetical protein
MDTLFLRGITDNLSRKLCSKSSIDQSGSDGLCGLQLAQNGLCMRKMAWASGRMPWVIAGKWPLELEQLHCFLEK